jgi:hypothetical protein
MSVVEQQPADTVVVAPRSPSRAAAYSVLFLGLGQIYNKQLEKAVLLWIWGAVHLGAGVLLLMLGLLGALLPRHITRPPLGDAVSDNAGAIFLSWLIAGFVLWVTNVRDAHVSAGRINRGEIVIRYPMRRQMVHVLASQLLGSVPLVGIFFPPGVVAEAIDAVHQKRGADTDRLLREGGQGLVEWMVARAALWGLWGFTAVWIIWWVLRALKLAP